MGKPPRGRQASGAHVPLFVLGGALSYQGPYQATSGKVRTDSTERARVRQGRRRVWYAVTTANSGCRTAMEKPWSDIYDSASPMAEPSRSSRSRQSLRGDSDAENAAAEVPRAQRAGAYTEAQPPNRAAARLGAMTGVEGGAAKTAQEWMRLGRIASDGAQPRPPAPHNKRCSTRKRAYPDRKSVV